MKRQSAGLAGERVARRCPPAAEIDHNDGKDGAELDQHLEQPAGAVEAQEMPDQQEVGGRGDRAGIR